MRVQPRKPSWPFTLNGGCRQSRRLRFYYVGAAATGPLMLDVAGKSNHATFATNSGALPTWTFGKDGGSAVFLPGTAGNRIVPRNLLGITGNSPVTVSAWVRFTNTAGAPGEVIHNFGSDAPNQEVFTARLSTGQFYSEFGAGTGAVTGITVMAPGIWYHVCSVYDGAANVAYVNGVAEASTVYSSANFGNTQCSFGSYLNSGNYKFEMSGAIEEIRVYDRALSAGEVRDFYDRDSRWQLRWQPSQTSRLFISTSSAPPVGRNYLINQAVFTNANH